MTERYPYHDQDWLLEKLGSNSVEEISDIADVTPQTIERWIDKHGIEYTSPEPQVNTAASEGATVPRETIDTNTVETNDVVVEESEVHDDGIDGGGDGGETTVETNSERAHAHTNDVSFPEQIKLLGVGRCQMCYREEQMLGAHPVSGPDEVSVCDRCDDWMRGLTPNTKRTTLNNPRVPYWNERDNDDESDN